MLKAELDQHSLVDIPGKPHNCGSNSETHRSNEPAYPSSSTSNSLQPRGRSRERFRFLQDHLISRARSVSSECELRGLIKDARAVAAIERVDEDN